MTVQRWVSTTIAMALAGWALLVLAPEGDTVRAAIADPQALADTRGPDALLVLLAWALAVLCWGWGALGLVLTGLSTVPGVVGRAAGTAVLVLLPAGLRRAAAVAVGVSLVTGPVLAAPGPAAAPPQLSAVSLAGAVVPDWPVAGEPANPAPAEPTPAAAEPIAPSSTAPEPTTPGPTTPGPTASVPDWPTAPPDGAHVVLRGDTLWDLAEARLAQHAPGTAPDPAAVAAAVTAWWQANADVIGPDPDRLLPGQVLTPPAS